MIIRINTISVDTLDPTGVICAKCGKQRYGTGSESTPMPFCVCLLDWINEGHKISNPGATAGRKEV